jgi:antitoxin component YwqK of YwqJK toxin-antitoxin module
MDENLNSADPAKATVTGKGYIENGQLKLDCFLKATGRLFMSASFTDSTLGTLQGLFSTYHTNGILESEGNYINSEMEGIWQNWNDSGLKTDSIIYIKGLRVAFAKFNYYTSKGVMKSSFTDSLNNTFTEKEYAEKGEITSEVLFTGNKGVFIRYDSTGLIKKDSVFSRTIKEASFKGGDVAWRRYLSSSVNMDALIKKNAPDGDYTVVIKFIVNEDGSISDITAENHPGYGADEEAIRVIRLSPKWEPAIQYGKFIKAYRLQPISFTISGQ